MSTPPPSPADRDAALRTLAWLAEHPSDVDDPLGRAVAKAYRRVRKGRRIVAARERRPVGTAAGDRRCYVCREPYPPHAGPYPMLCPACAAENGARRHRRGDLRGRVAVVTGARVKIGYQTALKLLRDGARVIATTRYPADAAARYAAEPDFGRWRDRLSVRALDLLDLRAVHATADDLCRRLPGLDILVNNAAQTVRRPAAVRAAMLAREASLPLPADVRGVVVAGPAASPERSVAVTVPADDPAASHSWLLPLEHVDTVELAEVMVVNAMAPFVLAARLDPLLRRSPFADRYVVHVTSAEGRAAGNRGPDHPHTNMAKAALDTLTRTTAGRSAEAGIYVNGVDPGWVTFMPAVDPRAPDGADADGPPAVGAATPPLDAVDGAARVYDPILRGLAGEPVYGRLLKDYRVVDW